MSETPQRKVGIRRGPFMGYEGRVMGRRGELWLVRITLYGREVEVEVAPEEIEERDDPMAALSRELSALIPQALEAHLLTWWSTHDAAREEDPLHAWTHWRRERQELEWAFSSLSRALLDQLAATDAPQRAALWAQLRAECFDLTSVDEPAQERAWERYHQARFSFESRREEELLRALGATLLPDEAAQRARREAARDAVLARRDAAREAAYASLGLRLPDDLFIFWACRDSLWPEQRRVWDAVLGLVPAGVSTLISSPHPVSALQPRRDARLVGRYYEDPPELLTVATHPGRSVHYGLWFEQPGQPRGVVSANHSERAPTLRDHGPCLCDMALAALAHHEEVILALSALNEHTLLTQRFWAQSVRDAILAMRAAFPPSHPPEGVPLSAGLRLGTLDTIGAPIDQHHRRDVTGIIAELRHDPGAATTRYEAALRCDAQAAPHTLALARDYHNLSLQMPEREARAAALFDAAYAALGWDAQRQIARAHAAHRHEPPDQYGPHQG